MIAAPASRQGKTLFTAALARYYFRQGYKVCVFKIGPDFLDPKLLEHASGQAAENLDDWMMGTAYCQQRLKDARQINDIVLIESVMGLFDHEPSNADFALQFAIPIILIADARSMGASFAAIAYGLVHLQPDLDIMGIIANRIGSVYHQQLIQKKLPRDIAFLGAIPRNKHMQLPERHLGLFQPHELNHLDDYLDKAADIISQYPLKIPVVVKLNRPYSLSPQLLTTPKSTNTRQKSDSSYTIAIASDAAFSFIYHANIRLLHDNGCQLVFFSPLYDQALPPCDALWLTGGYPELHAETLADNTTMQQSIRQHHIDNKPIYAECGGMLYLCEQLHTQTGQRYSMCGLLPTTAKMQNRLQGIGMQQLQWEQHTIRGHSFHHACLENDLQSITYSQQRFADKQGEALYQHGSIYASFLHMWFPSSVEIVKKLFVISQ
jgi:cobyrinic acid a,c-diamide synthase